MSGRGSGAGVATGAAGGSAARRACVSRAARARDWRSTSAQRDAAVASWTIASRSEEHTSELQSRLHLVCRLLLEKKKHYRLLLFHIDQKRFMFDLVLLRLN